VEDVIKRESFVKPLCKTAVNESDGNLFCRGIAVRNIESAERCVSAVLHKRSFKMLFISRLFTRIYCWNP